MSVISSRTQKWTLRKNEILKSKRPGPARCFILTKTTMAIRTVAWLLKTATGIEILSTQQPADDAKPEEKQKKPDDLVDIPRHLNWVQTSSFAAKQIVTSDATSEIKAIDAAHEILIRHADTIEQICAGLKKGNMKDESKTLHNFFMTVTFLCRYQKCMYELHALIDMLVEVKDIIRKIKLAVNKTKVDERWSRMRSATLWIGICKVWLDLSSISRRIAELPSSGPSSEQLSGLFEYARVRLSYRIHRLHEFIVPHSNAFKVTEEYRVEKLQTIFQFVENEHMDENSVVDVFVRWSQWMENDERYEKFKTRVASMSVEQIANLVEGDQSVVKLRVKAILLEKTEVDPR